MAASSAEQAGRGMTPERWQQICDLLGQALALPPDQRPAFMNQACPSDTALRQEVEILLASSDNVRTSFLESRPPPFDQFGSNGARDAEGALRDGQVFAERFTLVRQLGEGGMGQVWLAEQTSPVRRPVAVKLIRAGMYDESVVKRFQDRGSVGPETLCFRASLEQTAEPPFR